MNNISLILLESIILIAAIMVISTKNIFRSAIFLLLCFIGFSFYYFELNLNVLAVIQVFIYAGGITVLIIFSIFLTKRFDNKFIFNSLKNNILSLGLAILLLSVFMIGLSTSQINSPEQKKFNYSTILTSDSLIIKDSLYQSNTKLPEFSFKDIGYKFLDTNSAYFLPFELISIILLITLIGTITILIYSNKSQ